MWLTFPDGDARTLLTGLPTSRDPIHRDVSHSAPNRQSFSTDFENFGQVRRKQFDDESAQSERLVRCERFGKQVTDRLHAQNRLDRFKQFNAARRKQSRAINSLA